MPGCMLSATKASFSSVEKRRLRATRVITSTFENVSDIGTCLGLSLGPPVKAGVRSKRGAVQGRRMPGEDERQIRRWNAMRRHVAQIRRHCELRDLRCRPRQRQALLHWAYDSQAL